MSQTLTQINIHLVFSTKNRIPYFDYATQIELWKYTAGILSANGCAPIIVGGFDEHEHCFFDLSRNLSISQIARDIKVSSTKWLREKGGILSDFHWQNGYAAFSVSNSMVSNVVEYISRQREHHGNNVSFEKELITLCEMSNVTYNPAYLFSDD